ncbi:MAG: GTPase Era [Alphaproteobacteria bacterium]|nr:GTPase Era [Alphaproteobacteria bacterium]
MPADQEQNHRCGFVAVIGAPNAGKSTLVNALVGTKVSIVTPKEQTTRTIVRGIVMYGDTQAIFVDTPGIFHPKQRFERAMVAAAWAGAADAELVMLVIDSTKAVDSEIEKIIGQIKSAKRAAVAVLNKTDIVNKPKLLDLAAKLHSRAAFAEIFMVSAKSGDGLDAIKSYLIRTLTPGPWMFPPDDVSDMPGRLLAAEVTREKLFLNLHQEVPYGCAVVSENWEERKDGSIKIDQTILVARDGHKAIVLGEKGKRIKAVGEQARRELKSLLERDVHLFLHVKVDENWRNDRGLFSTWGLDFNA